MMVLWWCFFKALFVSVSGTVEYAEEITSVDLFMHEVIWYMAYAMKYASKKYKDKSLGKCWLLLKKTIDTYLDLYIVLSALFKIIYFKELKRWTKTTMPTKTDKVNLFWVCYWDCGWKYHLREVITITFTELYLVVSPFRAGVRWYLFEVL